MQMSADRKWMIKSDNKILGPYTFDQIEDLLKKKQINLIDEVRDMDTRWMYIRESEPLKEIVDNIRNEMSKVDEHTKTFQTKTSQQFGNSDTNVTITKSTTKTIADAELLSQPPPLPTFTSVSTTTPQDVDFVETNKSTAKSPVKNNGVKQYISEKDPQVKQQIQSDAKRIIYGLLFVIVLLVASGAGYYYYNLHQQKKYEQITLATMRKYSFYGLDAKIVELFSGLSPQMQKIVLPEIIAYIPKLDLAGLLNGTETVSSMRANKNLDANKKSILDLIEFNQALADNNLKKAREAIIRARDLDPVSEVIAENEAVLLFYEKEFAKAAEMFLARFRANPRGRTLYGYALSSIFSPIGLDETRLISEIDRYTALKIDYKKELLLLNMYLNKKSNREANFMSAFNSFISTPVGIQKQFQVSPAVFSKFYNISLADTVYDKLRSMLSGAQRTIVDVHYKLEKSEFATAQEIFNNNLGVFDKPEDKINLQIQIDYVLKNYTAIVMADKSIAVNKLNLASHFSMLVAKKNLDMPQEDLMISAEFVKREKNILALWAELLTINDLKRQLIFLQMNASTVDDFLPFQEIKGQNSL